VKVGVIGLGAMGKNHARVLSNMSSVDEVELYDPLGSIIGELDGKTVSNSLDSFLDQKFDYCVISSPTSTHRDLALKLADLGIAALIEKPIAFSVNEGVEISKAFEAHKLLGTVGHIERYSPAIIALREKLSTGILGKIFQITTRRVGPFSGRIRDVGVVKDLASHDIDLVSSISGSNYKTVFSQLSYPLGSGHEDALLAIGEMENGIHFSHVVNWISPTKERVTSVLGENGLMVADTLLGKLSLYENGSVVPNWSGPPDERGVSEGAVKTFELELVEPLLSEHRAFQSALVSGSRESVVSLDEGLNVLAVAERMLQSYVLRPSSD
jgi:UDP-N-acetylglucosamine 3-dehydrogenase